MSDHIVFLQDIAERNLRAHLKDKDDQELIRLFNEFWMLNANHRNEYYAETLFKVMCERGM